MTRREFLSTTAFAALPISGGDIQWLICRADGIVQPGNWTEPLKAVSPGSMMKPFLALAYLATHETAPILYCSGVSSGCWLRDGHGRQDLVAALANSCNAYFLQIVERSIEPPWTESASISICFHLLAIGARDG